MVADNGSTDGSRDLAISIGARLLDVPCQVTERRLEGD